MAVTTSGKTRTTFKTIGIFVVIFLTGALVTGWIILMNSCFSIMHGDVARYSFLFIALYISGFGAGSSISTRRISSRVVSFIPHLMILVSLFFFILIVFLPTVILVNIPVSGIPGLFIALFVIFGMTTGLTYSKYIIKYRTLNPGKSCYYLFPALFLLGGILSASLFIYSVPVTGIKNSSLFVIFLAGFIYLIVPLFRLIIHRAISGKSSR